ncbi:MAG: XylR N-terminal domain-containing protein [Labilithrix sp.]|nr:XylR N-terminal domain-containing protein [Labilithrix sp.]MCW5809834.1 XylR N-terminal domain-containing protein [Labilithrix sp.]
MDETARLHARIAELEAENLRLRRGVFVPSGPTVATPPGLTPLFAEAERAIRELFGRIEIDPARAHIAVGDERYLMVRASAFAIDFLDTLVQLYADRGEREALAIARGFLFDIAHTIGVHDARVVHAQLGAKDPIAKLSAGPVRFAYAGWASVEIDPRSNPSPDEDYCLVFEHTYSFEAAAFVRAGRRSEGPVCIMNAGYSSGWCKESFGVDLTTLEATCKARGDASCAFVMAPPHKVAERVREHFGTEHESLASKGFGIPTYFERKHVEEELVRRERLATVGLLVSGVAHEVNTPLGVAVTASGVLAEELTSLRARFDAGELTKGDLRAFFERSGQAGAMVSANLERAATEIAKFKRVSVDHATEERRAIDVGDYVRHTLKSLQPIVRKGNLALDVATEGDLSCLTFPGVLAQIVTNFITNSAVHASRDDGAALPVHLRIARLSEGQLELTYADEGRGMTEAVRAQAFAPFFTTRRTGGTGLGLHIVQSLVADVLRGRITLTSAPDRGTRFVVTFPVSAASDGA